MNEQYGLFCLQLFAEGSNDTGVTAEAAAQHTGVTAPEKPEQAPDAAVPEPMEDPNASFDALIKGKYKPQFQAIVQDIVRKRLAGKDPEGAGQEEPALMQDAPPQDHAAMEDLTQKLRTLDQRSRAWQQDAQKVKALYPAFDMRQECLNPTFVNLLGSGVDLRTAYEVVHNHEILPAAMEYAARTVEAALAKKIAAGTNRPHENGMSVRSSAYLKGDVSKFSKQEVDAIARRVARGERVTFG